MLAHACGQSHSLVARPAKMFPAECPPPPGDHAIYAGSGQIGLAGSDHKARRAQIRRLAKQLATDRRRQFLKVQLAKLMSRKDRFSAALSLPDSAGPMRP